MSITVHNNIMQDLPMEKLGSILEMLGPIVEFGKMIWAPISEYYNYHKNASELMKNLKRKRQELECGKSDIELKMGAELFPGKRPKKEVQFWLQKVETINGEIETIEQEAGKVKYSNACIGKNCLQENTRGGRINESKRWFR